MKTYTLIANPTLQQRIEHVYSDEIVLKTIPYARCFIKTEGTSITIYTSGKVVIQGPKSEDVLSLIQGLSKEPLEIKASKDATNPSKKEPQKSSIPFFAHAGSDEVGTGDYFGPMVVCAAYVAEASQVDDLPIADSKLITDDVILSMAPTLMQRLVYSVLVLDNAKYNQMHKTYNMNQLKAILHNQAFLHLYKKLNQKPKSIIDQFTPEASYYRYLVAQPDIVRSLHFETKAESKYLGVACAAIIARYHFLVSLKQLEEAFDIKLPKGASHAVDKAAALIMQTHGMTTLSKVAKVHFKNTEKAKELI